MRTLLKHIKKNSLFGLLGLLFISVLVSQCEIQENFEYQYDGSTAEINMTAWQFIQKQDSLSMMEQAVIQAGLEDLFNNSDSKTFILPENVGFRKYLSTNHYASIEAIPSDVLESTLKYHVVDAVVNFSNVDLLESNKPIAYDTENGQIMYLSHNTSFQGLINQGTLKQWTIYTSNIVPTNGVIHITQDVVYLLQ